MKSKFHFKKILHLAIVLVIGVISPVSSMAVTFNETEWANSNTMAYQAKITQVIKVNSQTQRQPLINVVSSSFSTDLAGCAVLKETAGRVVQGQSFVNLNQPASCFKLVMGSLPNAQEISIAVQTPLKSSVVVATWPVQIFQPNKFRPAPVSPTKLIPLLAYGFTAPIMLNLGIKIASRKINQELLTGFHQKSNLFEVMRC